MLIAPGPAKVGACLATSLESPGKQSLHVRVLASKEQVIQQVQTKLHLLATLA